MAGNFEFTPVPPGTSIDQAAAIRGPDPHVHLSDEHSFMRSHTHLMCEASSRADHSFTNYSTIGSTLGSGFIINDPTILHSSVVQQPPLPHAFSDLLLGLETIDADALSTLESDRPHPVQAAINTILGKLDIDNLDPRIVLDATRITDTQTAHDGQVNLPNQQATRLLHEITYYMLSVPVEGMPGHFRTKYLGLFLYFSPGIFLAQNRSLPDAVPRLFMQELMAGARRADFPYLQPLSTVPSLAASSLVRHFINRMPKSNFVVQTFEAPYAAIPASRAVYVPRLHALHANLFLTSSLGAQVRQSIAENLYQFSGVEGLQMILQPKVHGAELLSLLDEMARRCFSPPRSAIASLSDLEALEQGVAGALPNLKDYLSPLPPPGAGGLPLHMAPNAGQDQTESSAAVNVGVVCKDRETYLERKNRAGTTSSNSSAFSAGGNSQQHVSLVQSIAAEDQSALDKALGSDTFIHLMGQVRAALAAQPIDSGLVALPLLGSGVLVIKKFAMGFRVNLASLPACGDLLRDAEIYVGRYEYNLSMALLRDPVTGAVPAHALAWTVGAERTALFRKHTLSSINFEDLAYETLGVLSRQIYEKIPVNFLCTNVERMERVVTLMRALEPWLGTPALAPNSLVVVASELVTFLRKVEETPLEARGRYYTAAKAFWRSALLSYDQVWQPIYGSFTPMPNLPTVSIPETAACWTILKEAVEDHQAYKLLVRAAPELLRQGSAQKIMPAGTTLVGGVVASMHDLRATIKRKERQDDDGPVLESNEAPHSGEKKSHSQRNMGTRSSRLVWGDNNTYFQYPSREEKFYPKTIASKLNVKASSLDWPVVCSSMKTAALRAQWATETGKPGCMHVSDTRFVVPAGLHDVLKTMGLKDFEGGRTGGTSRDYKTAPAEKRPRQLPTVKVCNLEPGPEHFYSKETLAEHPKWLYVFGENHAQHLTDEVSTGTQAIIRGLPNAMPIRTHPAPGQTYTAEHADEAMLRITADVSALVARVQAGEFERVVFPASNSLGCGATKLKADAPAIFEHLKQQVASAQKRITSIRPGPTRSPSDDKAASADESEGDDEDEDRHWKRRKKKPSDGDSDEAVKRRGDKDRSPSPGRGGGKGGKGKGGKGSKGKSKDNPPWASGSKGKGKGKGKGGKGKGGKGKVSFAGDTADPHERSDFEIMLDDQPSPPTSPPGPPMQGDRTLPPFLGWDVSDWVTEDPPPAPSNGTLAETVSVSEHACEHPRHAPVPMSEHACEHPQHAQESLTWGTPCCRVRAVRCPACQGYVCSACLQAVTPRDGGPGLEPCTCLAPSAPSATQQSPQKCLNWASDACQARITETLSPLVVLALACMYAQLQHLRSAVLALLMLGGRQAASIRAWARSMDDWMHEHLPMRPHFQPHSPPSSPDIEEGVSPSAVTLALSPSREADASTLDMEIEHDDPPPSPPPSPKGPDKIIAARKRKGSDLTPDHEPPEFDPDEMRRALYDSRTSHCADELRRQSQYRGQLLQGLQESAQLHAAQQLQLATQQRVQAIKGPPGHCDHGMGVWLTRCRRCDGQQCMTCGGGVDTGIVGSHPCECASPAAGMETGLSTMAEVQPDCVSSQAAPNTSGSSSTSSTARETSGQARARGSYDARDAEMQHGTLDTQPRPTQRLEEASQPAGDTSWLKLHGPENEESDTTKALAMAESDVQLADARRQNLQYQNAIDEQYQIRQSEALAEEMASMQHIAQLDPTVGDQDLAEALQRSQTHFKLARRGKPHASSSVSFQASQGADSRQMSSTELGLHSVTAQGTRVLLMIVAILHGQPPAVLLGQGGAYAFGMLCAEDLTQKAVALMTAPWADTLFPGQHVHSHVHSFFAADYTPGEGVVNRIVVAPISHRPGTYPLKRTLDAHDRSTVWCTLDSLAGTPLYEPAASAIYRAITKIGRLDIQDDMQQIVGASMTRADVQAVDASAALGRFRHGARPPSLAKQSIQRDYLRWDCTIEQALHHLHQGHEELSTALSQLPLDHPHRDAVCLAIHNLQPLGRDSLPPALCQRGVLPSFLEDELADLPFTSRVKPPTLPPRPPPVPQPSPVPGFHPTCIQHFFPPRCSCSPDCRLSYFDCKFSKWEALMHEWSLDILANGEDATVERPGWCIFGQHEMLPQGRGRVYQAGKHPGDEWTMVDFTAQVDTHLDRAFIAKYTQGYCDQDIVSHINHGVVFPGWRDLQLTFPPHLHSLAKGYSKVLTDLKRKSKLGWYTITDSVAFNLWMPIPMGMRERAANPDKPRLIVHASDGSRPDRLLHDSNGVETVSINRSMKRDEDKERGTDVATHLKWQSRLRTTATSPPPYGQPSPTSPVVKQIEFLHAFSGDEWRSDGFSAHLRALGSKCLDIDRINHPRDGNVLVEATYRHLCTRAEKGEFAGGLFGIPCDSTSIARFKPMHESGRPSWLGRPVRSRGPYIKGKPSAVLTPPERDYVRISNLLITRGLRLATLVANAGGEVAIENPVDRGDIENGHYEEAFADHPSLWTFPEVLTFQRTFGAIALTFPQCQLDDERPAHYQKLTTLLVTPALARHLLWLQDLVCTCKRHLNLAIGKDARGRSLSGASARYPAMMNRVLARAFHSVAKERSPATTPLWQIGGTLPPDHEQLQELHDARDPDKLPKEMKKSITEICSDETALLHLARILCTHCYALDDDFADFFYQLRTAASQQHLVGLIILEFDKLAKERPQLRYAQERVLPQGTVNGSNFGQRFSELILHAYRIELAKLEIPAMAAKRRQCTIFDSWCKRREAIDELEGIQRGSLLTNCRRTMESTYTDDSRLSAVGVEAFIHCLMAWHIVTTGFRLLMADVHKRKAGGHSQTLGLKLSIDLGIIWVPEDKLLRAIKDLNSVIHGTCPIDQYRSLLGLLVHLNFLTGMRASSMYGMWAPIKPGGPIDQGPKTILQGPSLSDALLKRAQQWHERLSMTSGATYLSAVAHLSPLLRVPQAAVRIFWKGDAAKEGTNHPGVAGVMGGQFWIRPFTRRELQLPIAVLEFVQVPANVWAFQDQVPPKSEVHLETDALSPTFSLTDDSAKSPLMQHVHATLLECPLFQALENRMHISHCWGEGNPIADAPSRGHLPLLYSLLSQIGAAPVNLPHPPQLDKLILELVELHESRDSTSILQRAANNSMRGSPIAHYLIEPPTPPPISPGVSYAAATPITAAPTTVRHFFHETAQASPGVVHLTVAPHRQMQSTSDSVNVNVQASWLARAMLEDNSPYALRPKGQTVEHLCFDVMDASLDNPSTAKKLDSNWKLWLRYCTHMGTSPWREDVSALNEYQRQRETILLANFLKWALTKMKGRRGNARAKPDAAQKCLTGVRKRHQQRNITLVAAPLINATLKRLCRRHIQDFGPMSLIPHRKEPLSHDILQQVLDIPEGTKIGREVLQWKTRKGRALKGLICLLTFTGLRKAELTSMDGTWATRAHITWLLRGKVYTDPPTSLLNNPVKGDCVIVVPPLSKSDQTGEVWGANPMYLPFMPDSPLCPFTAIAAIEVEDPTPLASRSKVPLISPCGALPFKGDYLDRLLPKLLSPIVGPSRVSVYSWHSFRIMLACALLAKGASRGMIQSLCRWQSEESLNIYARLNPATYAYWLVRSVNADVSSVSTANLPILSEADTAFELMHELQHAAPSN